MRLYYPDPLILLYLSSFLTFAAFMSMNEWNWYIFGAKGKNLLSRDIFFLVTIHIKPANQPPSLLIYYE